MDVGIKVCLFVIATTSVLVPIFAWFAIDRWVTRLRDAVRNAAGTVGGCISGAAQLATQHRPSAESVDRFDELCESLRRFLACVENGYRAREEKDAKRIERASRREQELLRRWEAHADDLRRAARGRQESADQSEAIASLLPPLRKIALCCDRIEKRHRELCCADAANDTEGGR